MMEIETTSLPEGPPPDVTVTVALLVTVPVNPAMLAVIVAVPGPTAVTAPPGEVTVATDFELVAQVAVPVMSVVVEGWLPWPITPVAVNCAEDPTPVKLTVEGVT
jgi:hypothetical protein